MERGDYKDEEAFRAKIGSLMQMAAREADFSLPTQRHEPLSPCFTSARLVTVSLTAGTVCESDRQVSYAKRESTVETKETASP